MTIFTDYIIYFNYVINNSKGRHCPRINNNGLLPFAVLKHNCLTPAVITVRTLILGIYDIFYFGTTELVTDLEIRLTEWIYDRMDNTISDERKKEMRREAAIRDDGEHYLVIIKKVMLRADKEAGILDYKKIEAAVETKTAKTAIIMDKLFKVTKESEEHFKKKFESNSASRDTAEKILKNFKASLEYNITNKRTLTIIDNVKEAV